MATTKQDGAAAVEEAAERDLAALAEYAFNRGVPGMTNLGRFALALAAGNGAEESAAIVRNRGTR